MPAVLLAGVAWLAPGVLGRARADDQLAQRCLQTARELLAAHDGRAAAAHLARALREDPTNRVAADLLLHTLTYRTFVRPVGSFIPEAHAGGDARSEFSPDGRFFVLFTSADANARIWDAHTARLVAELPGHEGGVSAAAFSPDGARIVTASYGGPARIWEVRTGRLRGEALQHEPETNNAHFSISVVKFTPDGQRILTICRGAARIWNPHGGLQLGPLPPDEVSGQPGHPLDYRAAAFSSNGRLLATSGGDGILRVWDARAGRPLPKRSPASV